MQFFFATVSLLALASALVPQLATAQSLQDRLLQRALKATSCEQVPNNGRYCKYEFSNMLSIGIKHVGGTDTVVGFRNSNIKNELYAVMYSGCVAVVPGEAHPPSYDKDYSVFISPKTGLIYRTSQECKATL